jgi:spore maturation protein SpmA
MFWLAILLMGKVASAQGGITIPNPIACEEIGCVLEKVASFLLKIATPILTIMVLWAGFLFLTSAGNPEKVAKARQALLWAVIGFAIVLINWGFASIVKEILGGGK